MSESRGDADGVRKAPRHEIAVGSAARCGGALWGIEGGTQFRGPVISNGYRSRMRPQLGRYGMDIAKWGKYLLAHV